MNGKDEKHIRSLSQKT